MSWQISHGYSDETIDPDDRRRRYLRPTTKGKAEMRRLIQQVDELFGELFGDVRNMTEGISSERSMPNPGQILMRMEELTKASARHAD